MKSIKVKLYLFLISTIILIASSIIIFSYIVSRKQIDTYYKNITTENSKNFAYNIDGDFIAKLRTLLESDEYQELREIAEENDDEELIKNYLIEHDLWEEYSTIQSNIDNYLANMNTIKYIYIMAYGGKDATEDMYLIDSTDEPIYESGFYEIREDQLMNTEILEVEPAISYSDEWGWLYSDYAPIYDSNKNLVAIVGCDVKVQDMISARCQYLIYAIIGSLIISSIIFIGAIAFNSKLIIKPLKSISKQVQEFKPSDDTLEANIINMEFNTKNEITEIYDNIRSMEIDIVDYIKNIHSMEKTIETKDNQINKLSVETLKDPLTRVGNKGAYLQKIQELNKSTNNFAIIMVDINNLKQINDEFGHKAGDKYIQGCCKLICDTFTHSPVYRIGGDEFVVIIENNDYDNRYILYNQLKGLFTQSFLSENNKPWEKLSASVGMAENSLDDNSAELVFKRADRAMYEEKTKFREKYGSYR